MKRTDAGKEKEEQEKERLDVETACLAGRARNPTGKSRPEFFHLIFRNETVPQPSRAWLWNILIETAYSFSRLSQY